VVLRGKGADDVAEGLLGVAIVSGVALAAGIVGSVVWKGLSRKR
jgi:fission 1 protein